MRVTVDENKCMASAQCLMWAEGVFELREEDGVAAPLTADPPPERHEDVRMAASLCPARAITVEELRTRRQSAWF